MSTSDLWMRDVSAKYALSLFSIACFFLLISKKWSKICACIYRHHLLGFETDCAELASSYKKALLEPLESLTSHDVVLRSMKSIRILEIGVKTGENIQYFPDGSYFIAVDWNKKLMEYLIHGERSWQFSHVLLERLIIGDGSSLKCLPPECIDAVITTRSLCSNSSIVVTLHEIRRVLVPGGKYFFMEHIPEPEGTFLRWVQKVLSKHIWPSLFGNCRLDIDPTDYIKKAGFKDVTYRNIKLVNNCSYYQPLHLILSGRHIIGTATR